MREHTLTRSIGPLSLRADISADDDKPTAEVVWTTGARVLRGFFERYYEELSLDPKHVRMGRLESGRAPLLDSHESYDSRGVIGVVESARLENGRGTAVVRFVEGDARADDVRNKVKQRVLLNVSVGYRVYRYEKVEGGDEQIPVYRAVDWEPFEISAVPMGADEGAAFRAASQTTPCVFVDARSSSMGMEDPQGGSPAPATATVTPPPVEGQRTQTPAPTPDEIREAARRDELARITEIQTLARSLKLPEEFTDGLVRSGVDAAEASKRIIAEKARRESDVGGPSRIPSGAPGIHGGDEARDHFRAGVANALGHRLGVDKLDDNGRRFRSKHTLELCRDAVMMAGASRSAVDTMSREHVALAALGKRELMARAGMHSSSDLPDLFSDLAGKNLRRGYDAAPQTFAPIVRKVTLPDFKERKLLQFSEGPSLLQVVEGGQYERGSVTEAKVTWSLSKYGRIFSVTWEAMLADDLDALSRLPMQFGQQARNLESDLVWAQLTGNPTMPYDSVALFDSAHGNYTASGTAISVTSLGVARTLMRKQTGLDGATFINVTPRFLIVPAALETIAQQYTSQAYVPEQSSNINPFASALKVISEPRLDAADSNGWYLASSPDEIDMIEVGTLDGQGDGPTISTRDGFDTDGMELKARHVFGCKVVDHRGFYFNVGA